MARSPAEQRDTAAVLDAYATFQLLTGLRNGPWGAHALNRYVADVLGVEATGGMKVVRLWSLKIITG